METNQLFEALEEEDAEIKQDEAEIAGPLEPLKTKEEVYCGSDSRDGGLEVGPLLEDQKKDEDISGESEVKDTSKPLELDPKEYAAPEYRSEKESCFVASPVSDPAMTCGKCSKSVKPLAASRRIDPIYQQSTRVYPIVDHLKHCLKVCTNSVWHNPISFR